MSLRRWTFRDRRPDHELGAWPGELRLARELRAGQGGDVVAEELGELQGEGVRELGGVDALAAATVGEGVRPEPRTDRGLECTRRRLLEAERA